MLRDYQLEQQLNTVREELSYALFQVRTKPTREDPEQWSCVRIAGDIFVSAASNALLSGALYGSKSNAYKCIPLHTSRRSDMLGRQLDAEYYLLV